MAGLLQEIPAVGPLEREHGPARPAGLLLYLAGRQDRPDRLRRGVADGGAPRPEPLPVPFGVVPVRVGHVVRVGAVLASAPGPPVDGDPPAVRHHGDRPRRRGHGDRALHEFERNRVPGAVEAHVVVKIDRELLADRHLAGSRRQRDEQRLFLGEEYALPVAIAPLEGARVDGGDLVRRSGVELLQRHEPPVPQREHRLALDEADAHLHAGLAPRPSSPGGHDGAPVVPAHAPVPLVDDEGLLGVLGRGLDYRQNVERVSAARGITNGKAYRTQPSWKTPVMKNGSKPVDVPQKTNERRCLEGNL